MTPEEFFETAKRKLNLPKTAKLMSTYAFGIDSDKLAQLVLNGVKTATTSAYDLYEPGEHVPEKGEYDVITNHKNEPVCVTYTDEVRVCPFLEVSAEHAYREGEGDRSLTSWRQAHADFFRKEYQMERDEVFDPKKALMLLEHFHVIYPPKKR